MAVSSAQLGWGSEPFGSENPPGDLEAASGDVGALSQERSVWWFVGVFIVPLVIARLLWEYGEEG